MKYLCPVCGYDALPTAPSDYAICPSCGTEFGYDDVAHSLEELCDRWLDAGAHWFSSHTPAPPNWNAASQLVSLLRQKLSGQTIANDVTLLGSSVAELEEKRVASTTKNVNIKAATAA